MKSIDDKTGFWHIHRMFAVKRQTEMTLGEKKGIEPKTAVFTLDKSYVTEPVRHPHCVLKCWHEVFTKLKTCLIHNHTITEKIYKVKIPISAHLTLRQLVWKHTPFTLWAVVKLYEPNQKRTTFTLKAICAFWNEFIAETICSFYFGSKCSPFPGWGLNSKSLLRSWRFPCKLQVTAATCYQPN